jgi:enamine deaminase RidA (YjgF/YER057c/UK114 family)
MDAEQRIKDLGLELPPGSAPAGNYATAVRSGNLLFISGKAPLPIGGKPPKGRLGREYSINAIPEFEEHAKVLDGASDLLVAVFGPAGVHARSVIGVSSLRNELPLTLKATVEVKQE